MVDEWLDRREIYGRSEAEVLVRAAGLDEGHHGHYMLMLGGRTNTIVWASYVLKALLLSFSFPCVVFLLIMPGDIYLTWLTQYQRQQWEISRQLVDSYQISLALKKLANRMRHVQKKTVEREFRNTRIGTNSCFQSWYLSVYRPQLRHIWDSYIKQLDLTHLSINFSRILLKHPSTFQIEPNLYTMYPKLP